MTDRSGGLTAPLGKLARWSGNVPFSDPASVPYRAWVAWFAMKSRAAAAGSPRTEFEANGHTFEGKLASILYDTITEFPTIGKDAQRRIRDDDSSYLRGTQNAICVQYNTEPIIWWVRDEWNNAHPTGESRVASRCTPTRTESKLRPEEVGEDREPSPVSVRSVEPVTGDVVTTTVEHASTNGVVSDDSSDGIDSATPGTVFVSAKNASTHHIDPRWFGELVRAYGSKQGSITQRVMGALLVCPATFTARIIADALKLPTTSNVSTVLSTIHDAGLIGLQKPQDDRYVTQAINWVITKAQRGTIQSIIEYENSGEPPTHDQVVAADILEIMGVGWHTMENIARRARVTRLRLYSMLTALEKDEQVERRVVKSRNRWRRVEPTAKEHANSHDDVDEVDVVADGATSPQPESNVAALATMLEDVILTRVSDATTDLRRELVDAYSELALAKAERDDAQEERDEARGTLDRLRGMLGS